MYHNYFYLKRLAFALNEILKGLEIIECFSQHKDEIIFGLADENTQHYLICNLKSQVGLIEIRENFSRAKKNSADLFPEILKLKVESVKPLSNDRSFKINIASGYSIIFKMHGSRSNLILTKSEQTIEIFKHNLPADFQTTAITLSKDLNLSKEHFSDINGNLPLFHPSLGKEIKQELQSEGYEEASLSIKWSMYSGIINMVEHADIRIYRNANNKPYLVFWDTADELILSSSDTILINNTFYQSFSQYENSDRIKNQLLKPINSNIKKSEGYIEKSETKLHELINRRSYEELANILMANLHHVPKRANKVELIDLYDEQEKHIVIKLNPEITPQHNAENYYRKAKNQNKEIKQLQENINARKKVLTQLVSQKDLIETTDCVADLKKLSKKSNQPIKAAVILPYKQIQYKGFDILIGKNAKSNDTLTLKVAKKDDLWLHAKDVSGSHVIIKQKPGHGFPKDVIEYAASIAADQSKRKTDSLCPVIYTPKKYIRKRKGDPPGAVVVEKEEVILVTPSQIL